MKIKVLKDFRDKTTAEIVAEQKLIKAGEIIECDKELAESRIALGLAEKVDELKSIKKSK